MPIIKQREINPRLIWELEQLSIHKGDKYKIHPLMARLYSSRGVEKAVELETELKYLLAPESLLGMSEAATLLINAITKDKSICIVADYDCDGASACALAIKGLKMLGAQRVSYLVPDRVVDGYGLTAEISRRVASTGADLLITVDNGIASVEGVQVAKSLGLEVLITDHHLPADRLPLADAIVNPNQPGCKFASKNLSGVGVMFYVLLGVRAHMRALGMFDAQPLNKGSEKTNHSAPLHAPLHAPLLALTHAHIPRIQPKLDVLLPLVALGSVADVVNLDTNNRILVEQGLRRMRSLNMPLGLKCLFEVCEKDPTKATVQDLGFSIGPRINAAGRLADMTIGIECLLSESYEKATELASELNQINLQRRSVESTMLDGALETAEQKSIKAYNQNHVLCVFDDSFHEGVVGIVASRIKERHQTPTFVFAPSQMSTPQGTVEVLKGSGRSIAGFHLRDALDLVSKRHPNVLIKFGGHAMAAGCTLLEKNFHTFEAALSNIAKSWLGETRGLQEIWTDGALEAEYFNFETVRALQSQVWGQGFAPPLFCNPVEVLKQRIVGDKHLSLRVLINNQECDAIWFNRTLNLERRVQLVYKIEIDSWSGQQKLKLHVEAAN